MAYRALQGPPKVVLQAARAPAQPRPEVALGAADRGSELCVHPPLAQTWQAASGALQGPPELVLQRARAPGLQKVQVTLLAPDRESEL